MTEAPAWPPTPPLTAILRGLESERASTVGKILFDAGFCALEVPLNRPGALAGIETLARIAPPHALVGAGTVTEPAQVDAVAEAGANGFGIGSALFSPGIALEELARRARALVEAWQHANHRIH